MLTSSRSSMRRHPLDICQQIPPVEVFEEPLREWPGQPPSFDRESLIGLVVMSVSLGLWILPWILLVREWWFK